MRAHDSGRFARGRFNQPALTSSPRLDKRKNDCSRTLIGFACLLSANIAIGSLQK
jgi:hypothetical protein